MSLDYLNLLLKKFPGIASGRKNFDYFESIIQIIPIKSLDKEHIDNAFNTLNQHSTPPIFGSTQTTATPKSNEIFENPLRGATTRKKK